MKFNKKNIFVLVSILFLSFMILFYGIRMIYFYNKEKRDKKVNYTLSEKIINDNKLINENDKYYFRKSEKNYLYYSGLMYRIISVDENTVYLITDENITKLKFGLNDDYDESFVKTWIENEYYMDLNKEFVKGRASLLTKEDYIKIGAKDSFIVNDDFWILDNNKALVLTENGSIAKTSNYSDFLGVKVTIKIDGSINYLKGNGSKNNPYILENKIVNSLNDAYIGEYIKYKDELFRVINKNNESIKVLSLNKLDEKEIFSNYSNKYSVKYRSDLGYKLNVSYIKKYDKKDLVDTLWYIGEYDLDYKSTENESMSTYIGLLKIGDYFISSIDNTYFLTPNKDLIYGIKDGVISLNEINKEKEIYPVLNLKKDLKITSGNGYIDNPYVVGD